MKLSLFLLSLGGGGAERVGVNLAKGFAEIHKAEVDLVIAKAQGSPAYRIPPGINVVSFEIKSLPQNVCQAVIKLSRYLRREKPTALISLVDHYNFLPLLANKLARTGTKIIVSFHINLSLRARNTPTVKSKLIPYIVRFFLPWADAIVAVSKGVAKDLAEITGLPEERIRVIYNPVVTPELFAKAEEPVDHPWFRPGEPSVILGVGRLTAQKDFPTLIRAFALVRKKRSARLMILGEGEDRPKLEALVRELGLENDVALPGFVDNPYKYMKRAAVFVLSSRWEGFGMVLVEAMACGTPVVATDCPSGPREILEDGKWGKLVPVGDAKQFAHAIEATLDEPMHPEVVRRAGDFTLEKAVDAYMDLLS